MFRETELTENGVCRTRRLVYNIQGRLELWKMESIGLGDWSIIYRVDWNFGKLRDLMVMK